MFKFIFRTIYFSLVLGGWSLAALSLHVVRTPDKIGLIPKQRLGFTDTYVDARKWTLSDLPAHAALVERVIQANKAELFSYMTDHSRDAAEQLNSAIGGSGSPGARRASSGGFGALLPEGVSLPAGVETASLPVDF
jgi:hypothetical protein